jgi:hypothetical protein
MKIQLKEITIRELTEDYEDKDEAGVTGYGGKLDIRPPYQREFIYKDRQRDAVIQTVTRSFPLNVMYWAVREDGNFEVIDGQQRTISICQFVNGDYSVMAGSFDAPRAFHNLQPDERERILDYKLMVYFCHGTESEKLEWFRTINIAGEKLTEQELRNAVYAGSWVTDAKRYFSKRNCVAEGLGSDYLVGSAIRQDYLETAIDWTSDGEIEAHMSANQHKANAGELWRYFQSVVTWVKSTFPEYRKEMKGVAWGQLYNSFKDADLDAGELELRIAKLMADEDVTKKRGIYSFVLDSKESHLSLRAFSDNQRREAYERQNGVCPACNKRFSFDEMHGDHITPWSKGGRTQAANCRMLCAEDNRRKSAV